MNQIVFIQKGAVAFQIPLAMLGEHKLVDVNMKK